MRVPPDRQRRGLGLANLEGLQRRAAKLGVRHLRLETTAGQVAAQELYRANGFVEVGRTTYAGFDVLVFEKQL